MDDPDHNPITINNTGHRDWSVEPLSTPVPDAPAQTYLHKTGRIEITIEPLEQSTWDSDAEESTTETVYLVNVYESLNYDYQNREYIDSHIVATIRPSTNGTGYASSFRTAQTLAINALLAIEQDNKWLSDPVDTPIREFVTPSLSADDAAALYQELRVEHAGGLPITSRDDAVDLAHDAGYTDLEEYLYSLPYEDDFTMFRETVGPNPGHTSA